MLEMIDNIVNMLISAQAVLTDGAKTLNDMSFDKSLLKQYFGYIHYGMGRPLYMLFTSIAIIALTITIYQVIVKGISYLRSCM